jgi:hypothetical protein
VDVTACWSEWLRGEGGGFRGDLSIQYLNSAWVISPEVTQTLPTICFFRDEVSHLDRYTLQRCTYIL